MKIMIHSSLAYSLINFRGALLQALADEGHEVTATAPDRDPQTESELSRMGIRFKQVPMARASLSPLKDLQTLWSYLRLMHVERPDVVISYTQKPIIYGGLAARLAGRCNFHVIMSGLGFVFSAAADSRPMLRKLVSRIYREGVRGASTIFVFNSDDQDEMLRHRIIDRNQNVVQVPGSGVNTRHFAAQPLVHSPPTVLMIARLMRDKGVHEFAESARIVKARIPEARFQILGRLEEANPTGVSREDLSRWSGDGIIELLPETRDVRPYLAAATIFALPSYHREGLPRTILEALASGRPVVTTSVPGCRDAIEAGVTGLIVPPRDPASLAAAIGELLLDRPRLEAMSQAARRVAERKYDVRLVNQMLIEELNLKQARGADALASTRSAPAPPSRFPLHDRREGQVDA